MKNEYRISIFYAFIVILSASHLFAQPPGYMPGYHWADRAVAYAQAFCDGINPEYGTEPNDCADFTSQIANAGCSGMCESNNTNFAGWTAPESICWDYLSSDPHSNYAHGCDPNHVNCVPCSTGQHLVINNANSQAWWFYCSDSNVVNHSVNVTDVSQIPDWVAKGSFVFRVRWDSGTTECKWHAVFIGSGSGSNVLYYAHNNNRCGAHLTGLFTEVGFEHNEFYKPLIFSPSEEDK